MEHADLSALPYRGYLIGKDTKEDPYKISRHHIIPQNILEQVKDYNCKDSKGTPFCMALLDGIEGEFCGNLKPNPDSKIKEPFIWETGNLYFGPSQNYRTDDSKSGFDDKVVPLLDCLGPDMLGTRLQSAFYSLMAYKDDVIEIKRISKIKNTTRKQEEIAKIEANEKLNKGSRDFYIGRINEVKKECDSDSDDFFCITAAHNLNLFYKGFCGVRNHPLYELDFYLKNFWKMAETNKNKTKFRLLKDGEINCKAIHDTTLLFESTKINGNADLVASMKRPETVDLKGKDMVQEDDTSFKKDEESKFPEDDTVFLEGEAVVSNHFHKTKTADASSSFILDDSVDARF